MGDFCGACGGYPPSRGCVTCGMYPVKRKRLKRIVHSPSSVSLAERCHRAWWLRYREGLKPPEYTWAQVCAWDRYHARKGRRPSFPEPQGGQRSTALGKEVHRLAEIYLTVRPRRVARRRLIDWTSLPGLCLAELVPHLPEAGSLTRADVERQVRVKAGGVRWRGVIDVALPVHVSRDLLAGAAAVVLDSADHKTSGDIRAYALLPPRTAARVARAWRRAVPPAAQKHLKAPARSLRDDLQACLYTLARAEGPKADAPGAVGTLCRWNYTETKRARRSLPVVAYVPTDHARAVVETHALTARTVAAFETIEDAKPNTLACDDYGGCWYRIEGHCTVPRRVGALILRADARAQEREAMAKDKSTPKRFKDLENDTAAANEAEEREARKAAKAKAKAKAKAEEDDEDDSDDEEDDEDEPESERRPAKGKGKRKAKAKEDDEDDSDDEEDDEAEDEEDDEDEAPPAKSKAKGKSARAAEQAKFDDAVSPENRILRHFDSWPQLALKGASDVLKDVGKTAHALSMLVTADNPERAVALRRLLEARDAVIRALDVQGQK